ncbi:PHB depolymerase family esterase [Cupriavidus sp. WKF15]|uniref:extracellular catalytic domain type 1 short-chain-length polyhydroxyalkanoate depolymerase n=1 Tax=Cupriavidus sp. WKF15 TaxID=3032282 RepID=UPI0023E3277A|nr:PHB depolymerase family esterase [Cupriavidus sp. WKF15]WER47881.1 PHB depolymerase family esterase [Cupriavidus sp. WKF15]
MAKSLAMDWQAQFRRFSRAQAQTEAQVKSWLERIESLSPLAPRRRIRTPHGAPLSPRHPVPQLPGSWESHRLRLAPLPGELVPQLSYHLYVPASAKRRFRGPLPVVVMLHGCRQTPDDLAAGTRMNALAEHEGFIVAYPQQPLRRQLQRCWQWFDLAAGEGGREAQAVATLIETLARRHDVCDDQVYVAGMSAGAAMAAVVALRYPERVAAVGLHSGVVVGAADNPRAGLKAMLHGSATDPAILLDAVGATPGGPELPAMVIHGLDDDAVHPVNGRLLARQFLAYNRLEDRLGGIPEAQVRMPAGHFHEARVGRWSHDLVTLVEVEGLGHAWSGGDGDYHYHSAIGPDASAMMWEFFREHRR